MTAVDKCLAKVKALASDGVLINPEDGLRLVAMVELLRAQRDQTVRLLVVAEFYQGAVG